MGNAYKLIEYHPKSVFNYIDGGISLTTTISKLATDIIAKVEGAGGLADFDKATDVLTINGKLAISIYVAGVATWRAGGYYGQLGVAQFSLEI